MRGNQWARLLADVTGVINQELLLHNEYVAAENRILRTHLPLAPSSSRDVELAIKIRTRSSAWLPASCIWVEGIGFRNFGTVRRNTLHTGGTNDFDLNLTKSIPLGKTRRLELR